jgi:hypothetical protein
LLLQGLFGAIGITPTTLTLPPLLWLLHTHVMITPQG